MKVVSLFLVVSLFFFQVPLMAADGPCPPCPPSAPKQAVKKSVPVTVTKPVPVQPVTINVTVENKAAEQQSSVSVSQSSPDLELVMEKMLTMDRQHQETLQAVVAAHERELTAQHRVFVGLLAGERMARRNEEVLPKKDFPWKSFVIGTAISFGTGVLVGRLSGGTKINLSNNMNANLNNSSSSHSAGGSAYLGGITVSPTMTNLGINSNTNTVSPTIANANTNTSTNTNTNQNDANANANANANQNQNQGQAQNANANASGGNPNSERTIPPPPPDPVVIVGNGTNNKVHSPSGGNP